MSEEEKVEEEEEEEEEDTFMLSDDQISDFKDAFKKFDAAGEPPSHTPILIRFKMIWKNCIYNLLKFDFEYSSESKKNFKTKNRTDSFLDNALLCTISVRSGS
jgi:hypothetical protein